MRSQIIATVLLLVFCASASAQQAPAPNPVMEHYRAYQAALARNDLATAETSAMAALAASEARDGDGGRTAVLALNLAMVRLDRDNALGAQPMAERAFSLATARTNTGVDPLMARLVLGQAELAAGDGAAGRARLLAALAEAQGRDELAERIMLAGNALGHSALQRKDYAVARQGFAAVVASVPGRDALSTYLRSSARLSEAIVIIKRDFDTREGEPELGREAMDIINGVVGELYPLTQTLSTDGSVTRAQRVYGQALAWRSAVRMAYDELPFPDDEVAGECRVIKDERSENSSARFYPNNAMERGQQGIVVLFGQFDTEGNLANIQAIASAPEDTFDSHAARLISYMDYRVDRSEPGCTVPRVRFIPVSFRLR